MNNKDKKAFMIIVIKISYFKQKVTLPGLYKRERGGLFLFDLCYQKDYNKSIYDHRIGRINMFV